ncbi:MAG TPA: hypothetical protein VH063_15265 [Gaiellaceae bacterium]|jgi:hypothetical protein|nr:hypothetical protein [Gaiellaceae bacterium]
MTTVVLPTLAVAASWLLFGVVILGCGFLIRAALLGCLAVERADRPAAADLWIGLGALVLYLLVWNQFAALTWAAWVVPGGAGAAGVMLGALRLRGLRGARPRWWVLGLVGPAVAWIANQALGPAEDYDFGLYHLAIVRYAEHFAAIPGLANLHSRFGAADAHLLLVAFLDHGPWSGAAPHLVNGLLASMLCVELGSRFVARAPDGTLSPFSQRMALLLVPVLFVGVANRPTHLVSSPNLDFAAFVLVLAGMLYLAEAVERDFAPTPVLAAGAALGTAAATRPLYWLPVAVAVVLPIVAARRATASRLVRTAVLAGALPVLLFVAVGVREAVLSGYPFFPATAFKLPVDWRVPLGIVVTQNTINHAFATGSTHPPAIVVRSLFWIRPWLTQKSTNPDVILPLILLAGLIPAAVFGGEPERRRRLAPMLAVVLPSLALLVAWFLLAPDPRFALAPLWLVPVGVGAWALPQKLRRPSTPVIVVGAVSAAFVALVFSRWSWHEPVPLAIMISLGATIVVRLVRRHPAGLGEGAALAGFAAGLAVLFVVRSLTIVHATPGGPLGTPPNPTPVLKTVASSSGLLLTKPVGSDQCWGVILCVPGLAEPGVRKRGATIADGFRH